jgi:hypothetical protein
MTCKIYVGWLEEVLVGPGCIASVVSAHDEDEAQRLALDMIGRAGRSTISENVPRMKWVEVGISTVEPQVFLGHWSR